MAKRPPSSPEAEDDVLKAVDAAEAAETVLVEPVTMQEPHRLDVDAGDPLPDVPQPEALDADHRPDHPTEPRPDPVVAAAPGERRGGSGFLGTALGGVVAAAAGYALATFVPFPGMGTSDTPPVATQAEVQALTARLAALESAPEPDAGLADRLAALEARPSEVPPLPDLSPVTESLAALESRLAVVESRGPSTLGDAPSADVLAMVEALRAEVAQMKAAGAEASAGLAALVAETEARLSEAEAPAVALKAEAEETARKALASAAAGRVKAALESGAPFASALPDLQGIDIPAALAASAETGVPSRAALESAFAPAARQALEASLRANMGEGWSDRIASFLQATTGARSLTPREGTDPDAVLSRAEAAVRADDLAGALSELQGLPPDGLAAMSDWMAMAQKRLDAVAAAAALTAAVEG